MRPLRLAFIYAILALTLPTTTACQSQPAAKAEPLKVEAGSSYETAIVLEGATNEGSGVRAEHVYVQKHYPTFTWQSQGVANKDGRVYDIVELVDGTETRTLYFDITSWFGKL